MKKNKNRPKSHHTESEETKEFSFSTNLEKYEEIIQELANELVYNHLANSFGDDTGQEVFTEYIFSNQEIKNDKIHFAPDFYGPEAKSFAAAFGKRKQQGNAKSCRNILVIGAGASYDSYKYVPLGGTLRTDLEKTFEADIVKSHLIEQKYEQEKKDIKRLSKGGYDFENCLSLLANFFPADSLRDHIQRLTHFRYEPSLFYEIVAHLFKHNFIDVILNFNFDELLDNSIEEEVGSQNYYHILHDGDCPSMGELIEDGRLRVPVYIKPHGTTRHTTTLRFTKRHYLDIPPKIKHLIEALVGGELRKTEDDNINRVNIICVGFDLTSLEFNEILDQHLPKDSRIYHIAHGNSSKEKINALQNIYLPNFLKNEAEHRLVTIDIADFKHNKIISPYAEVFSHLWRAGYSRFQDMYRPRSIGRHEILSYLFYRSQPNETLHKQENYFKIANNTEERKTHLIRHYFIDRIMVELALSLNRSNGLVDVIHLLSSRIGDYFNLYRQQALLCQEEKVHTIYQLLGEFTRKGEIDNKNVQTEFIYSRNVFRVIPFNEVELTKLLDKLENQERFKSKAFCQHFKHEILNVHRQNPITASILYLLFTSDIVSSVFTDMLTSDYNQPVQNSLLWNSQPKQLLNEVCRLFTKSAPRNYFYIRWSSRDQINHMWEGFTKQNLLLTSLAYKYHFRHNFLNAGHWDILLCVSESGSLIDFLDMLPKHQPEHQEVIEQLQNGSKRLIMICSYETVRQQHCSKGEDLDLSSLIEAHKNYLSVAGYIWNLDAIELLFLPYWQHNHHSILFLKKTDAKTIGKQGKEYYFHQTITDTQSELKQSIEGFLIYDSYYYYKKGFAKSINPIFFRKASNKQELELLKNDQLKLLSLYFTYICRAITFFSEISKNDNWFIHLPPCLNSVTTLSNYKRYTQWTPVQFNQYLTSFLTLLYNEKIK